MQQRACSTGRRRVPEGLNTERGNPSCAPCRSQGAETRYKAWGLEDRTSATGTPALLAFDSPSEQQLASTPARVALRSPRPRLCSQSFRHLCAASAFFFYFLFNIDSQEVAKMAQRRSPHPSSGFPRWSYLP